jgi:hypothetical protein
MPGFNIMGGGPANAKIESKRMHRWRFTTLGALNRRASVYLQKAQRPHAVIEEAVMHHDQEQVYFAGKHSWEMITLTFYDVTDSSVDASRDIWNWINTVINIQAASANVPTAYKRDSDLEMTNGFGSAVETWKIFNCWPKDVNWNDIDYTNTEIQTVDVSMRFDKALRTGAGGGFFGSLTIGIGDGGISGVSGALGGSIGGAIGDAVGSIGASIGF